MSLIQPAAATLGTLALLVPVGAASERLSGSYSRPDFHRAAKKAYDGKSPATRHERRTLRRVIRSQSAPRKSRAIIARHLKRYRSHHIYRLKVNRLTPYGRWAIPGYIVQCESRGSWSAYNSSGASGPYQLLGWGAPMPANTRARRLQHHRIASRLWSGGSGASNWVCA